MRVYLAGPLSHDDPQVKLSWVRAAMDAGLKVIKAGHQPFVPHLFYFLEQRMIEIGVDVTYEEWMSVDDSYLRLCEAFIYLAMSPGADRELDVAQKIGLKIFYSVDEFVEWAKQRV